LNLSVGDTLGFGYVQERIDAVLQPVITAALEAAIGLRHMYEQDPATGQWTRGTDPDAIAVRLNAPHLAAAYRPLPRRHPSVDAPPLDNFPVISSL
jgi:hypothetical protein